MRKAFDDAIWRGAALRARDERARVAAAPQRRRDDRAEAKPRSRRVAVVCAALALAAFGHAGYLSAKARLAQVLLERSWQTARDGGVAPAPWPWADTVPVARLRVPRLDIDEIVLSGDSGRTLAFGPGWAPSSAPPGVGGVAVVSGHRDTHFAFLRELALGDALSVETKHASVDYRVVSIRIADERREAIAEQRYGDALVLVTCYPFDAIAPGGPLRYVVVAEPSATNDARASAVPELVAASPQAAPQAALPSSSNRAIAARHL